ncbi:MAG: 4Fe-4S dicluster domain-containing protein [Methanomassiliicoccales archaeon]
MGGISLAQVLVIGGGPAGITAALNLAERGIFSTIVEKKPGIGGRASELCCKGVIECVRCDVCLSMDKIDDLVQSNFIRILTNTEVVRVSGQPGAFRVMLKRNTQYVREDACVGCGACDEVCPVEGSAIRPSSEYGAPRTFRIDEEKCIRLRNGECGKCAEVCPTAAIDFFPEASNKQLAVGAIVVANGFEPFDPVKEPRYGYGLYKDVVSSVDVERSIIRTGRILVPSSGETPKRIAIIQCVGSRDDRFGAGYCSKVCCKYALKIGQLLKRQDPEAEISFFFMDWRPYDLVDDELTGWATVEKNVTLIRSRPAEVLDCGSGKPILRFASADDEKVIEAEFDLVMLSVGILPPRDASSLARSLGLSISVQGFLEEGVAGVFPAGCCSGPKDIEESVEDGIAAAGKVASFLGELH